MLTRRSEKRIQMEKDKRRGFNGKNRVALPVENVPYLYLVAKSGFTPC